MHCNRHGVTTQTKIWNYCRPNHCLVYWGHPNGNIGNKGVPNFSCFQHAIGADLLETLLPTPPLLATPSWQPPRLATPPLCDPLLAIPLR